MKYHANRLMDKAAITPFTNHSFSFRQWLGRPLLPFERRIIEPLERYRYEMYYSERYSRSSHPVHIARLRRLASRPWRPMRIFVEDFGRHGDAIKTILILYTSWLQQYIEPQLSTCIVHRTKKLALHQIKGTSLHRSPHTILCSCKRAHSVRGLTFHSVLLLDADLYGRSTLRKYAHRCAMTGCEEWRSERTQAFRIVSEAVIAPISAGHNTMLIIHGNPLTHPRMYYSRLCRHALDNPADSSYTVISPDRKFGSPPNSDTFSAQCESDGRAAITIAFRCGFTRRTEAPALQQHGLQAAIPA